MEKWFYLSFINFLLYLGAFFVYHMKKKRIDLGTILLGIYAFANGTSVWYLSIDYVRPNYPNLTLLPYLFLFVCFLISAYPLLKFDNRKILKIESIGSGTFIYWICILLSLCSIEAFIENFHLAVSTPSGASADYLGKVYAGDINAASGLTWIGKKCNYILTMLRIVIVSLAFFQMYKKNYWLSGALALGVLSNLFIAYSSGSRGGIIESLAVILSCFLLYVNLLESVIVKKIIVFGSVSLILLGVFIGAITVARYNYNSDSTYRNSVWEWVALYSGEGSIRFNNDIWDLQEYRGGKQCLSILFPSNETNSQALESYYDRNGLLLIVFYTFVGDFVLDFGPIGAIIQCLLFSYLLKKSLTLDKGVMPLDRAIIYAVLVQILLIGYTAYIYRGEMFKYSALWPILFSLVLWYLRNDALRFKRR